MGMVVFAVLALFPITWILKMSIVPKEELFRSPPSLIPTKLDFTSYSTVWADDTFKQGLVNSVVIAGFTTVICLAIAYWGAIIPDVLFALPLTVYLLVAYFRELPEDMEEAARVDGATRWQAFTKVTVPLSVPGVVTTGLLTFIFAWNEFLFANTFLLDPTVQPATVLIPQFSRSSPPTTARRPRRRSS